VFYKENWLIKSQVFFLTRIKSQVEEVKKCSICNYPLVYKWQYAKKIEKHWTKKIEGKVLGYLSWQKAKKIESKRSLLKKKMNLMMISVCGIARQEEWRRDDFWFLKKRFRKKLFLLIGWYILWTLGTRKKKPSHKMCQKKTISLIIFLMVFNL
jgi:hypothetical protein